jgi:two-component system CheB/CheR fusion protein
VQDDGIGMPPSLLVRVFEPFVQADHSLARAQGGLGLGLTLVKKIAELHGGTITAASDGPGRGSLFTLRLPSRAVSELVPPAPKVVAAPKHPIRGRVLLAEDNEDTLSALTYFLKRQGHEVVTAMDGPEALELAVCNRPDVAVLDLGLPTMSGFALAQKIRGTPSLNGVHLIAVSGYGRAEDKVRAKEAGFDRHFTKPLDPAVLLAAIQESLAEQDRSASA